MDDLIKKSLEEDIAFIRQGISKMINDDGYLYYAWKHDYKETIFDMAVRLDVIEQKIKGL